MPEDVPAGEIEVVAVREASDGLLASMHRLIPQLSSSAPPLEAEALDQLLRSGPTILLVARTAGAGDDAVTGALSLVLYRIPTGVRAVIEDVVVDSEARGRGVGSLLVREALRIAGEHGARHVDLTSRPDREAANRLYQALGFERRDTNVYRWAPPAPPG
jgi:ribosomal protein S18 acetylase RimI-like enzyme